MTAEIAAPPKSAEGTGGEQNCLFLTGGPLSCLCVGGPTLHFECQWLHKLLTSQRPCDLCLGFGSHEVPLLFLYARGQKEIQCCSYGIHGSYGKCRFCTFFLIAINGSRWPHKALTTRETEEPCPLTITANLEWKKKKRRKWEVLGSVPVHLLKGLSAQTKIILLLPSCLQLINPSPSKSRLLYCLKGGGL